MRRKRFGVVIGFHCLLACSSPGGVVPADGGEPVDAGVEPGIDAGVRLALPKGTASAFIAATGCLQTAVPTSQCLRTIITCPGEAPLGVTLKVTEPTTATIAGTVVLGTGGQGTGIYEQFGPAAVQRIIRPLVAQGFRVVQRDWDAPGWVTGRAGLLSVACRYATLLDAIHSNVHTTGAFCASGNSGGSTEIAYALSHYGAEQILDLAVPTAGPPMGRLDYGCLAASTPQWIAQCGTLKTCGTGSCGYAAGAGVSTIDSAYDGGTPCSSADEASRQRFWDDSVVSQTAVLDYPRTEVRFVYGDADCTEAVPLGRVYAEAVTSTKSTTVVAGAPHAVPSHDLGAAQIYSHLSVSCIARH